MQRIVKSTLFALLIASGIASVSGDATAKTYFNFSLRGPGYSLHFGDAPRYYRQAPYSRYRYYRAPRQGRTLRFYRRPAVGGYCTYWAGRCAQNWGYGNANYRGCLRYYHCR